MKSYCKISWTMTSTCNIFWQPFIQSFMTWRRADPFWLHRTNTLLYTVLHYKHWSECLMQCFSSRNNTPLYHLFAFSLQCYDIASSCLKLWKLYDEIPITVLSMLLQILCERVCTVVQHSRPGVSVLHGAVQLYHPHINVRHSWWVIINVECSNYALQ